MGPDQATVAHCAQGSLNIAEALLMRGLAQTAKHRGDEERAASYETLLAAEEQAKAVSWAGLARDTPDNVGFVRK